MPRVISSDVRVSLWAHHQNGLSHENVSDKLSLDGLCASKREINKIIREIKLERQGAIKSVKRLRSLRLYPARSVSTIFESEKFHQSSRSLAAAIGFQEAERPPHNYQADCQVGSGGKRCDPSAKLITCQTRWWLNSWQKVPTFSSISSVGISASGPTTIQFVPPDAIVNVSLYINKILKQFPVCLGRTPILPCCITTPPKRTRPRPPSNG